MACKAFTALHSLIDRRGHDIQSVELFHNTACRNPICIPVENHADNFGGLWVNNQLMPILRAFLITVGGIVTKKFPPFPLHCKGGFDLDGELPDVVIVHDVGEGNNGATISVGVFQTVDVVQDRNNTDAFLREILLHKSAKFRVIAAQPGIILKNDAVDFSRLNIGNHPFILWPVKISAWVAIIGIDFNRSNYFALIFQILDMLLNDSLLILDAVTFQFISILFAEPNINSYVPLNIRCTCFISLVLHKGHIHSFLLNLLYLQNNIYNYIVANTERNVKNLRFLSCVQKE